MALGRVKTWISEILTAADLNAEFNNILNNATSLISPATAAWDMDGKELIIDADADTSITADTDDQIDFKVGGSDLYRMTTTGFSTLSSATITSAGALTVTAGNITATAGDVNLTAGAINTARATVASAATTADIWAANGNQIDWTGTTTCTGFPAAPQAGVSRTLICADAAPFTAGANMLIDGVSSGSTVTCAANDKMIVEAVTTTQFRLSRVKYDGTAQVAAWTLLQTATASASATIDLETGIGSAYDDYVIIAEGIRPATDGSSLTVRLKISGAYVTTTYYYHVSTPSSAANTYAGSGGANTPEIYVLPSLDSAHAASTADITIWVRNVNQTTLAKLIDWRGTITDLTANTLTATSGGGGHLSSFGALTGVRFLMSAGNISVGTFRLYGITKT